MDTLNITGLKIATKIGVHTWEQKINQNLLIDLTILADFSACEDDLAKTIDYNSLCQSITQLISEQSFQLIETVADTIAKYILLEFEVKQVTVKVTKPHAIENACGVSIQITRSK